MRRRSQTILILGLILASAGSVVWQLAVAQPSTATDKKEGDADKDGRRQLLEAVGALAASELYHAYLNIGLIADGKAEGSYEQKDIEQILNTVLTLLDTLDKQLERVGKLELTTEDRDELVRIRHLSALLRQQGDELQAFWKTGDKEHGTKYEAARKEAWAGISSLLGLK